MQKRVIQNQYDVQMFIDLYDMYRKWTLTHSEYCICHEYWILYQYSKVGSRQSLHTVKFLNISMVSFFSHYSYSYEILYEQFH